MPNLNPPPGMPPDRQTIWHDTIRQLTDAGTIFRIDHNALAAYVAAVANHRQATRLIEQTGVLLDHNGTPTQNPALTTQNQAATIIHAFGKQFGLTRHQPPGQQAAPQAPAPVMGAGTVMESDPAGEGHWCGEHKRWECTKNKHGKVRCHKSRMRGTNACNFHQGDQPTARGKIALGKVADKIPTYGQPLDVSPGEALLQEVRRTAGIVDWLGIVIARLAEGDVVWGIERTASHSGGDFPGSDVITSAKPNVWVELYQKERRHLVATCEAALRANVDERLVRLAEMQGGRIVAVLNGIFSDLELLDWQRERLPEVVPRRIRELAA
jgi:P27 family predicted phage terminase small subunit